MMRWTSLLLLANGGVNISAIDMGTPQSGAPAAPGATNSKPLRFVSPLQTFTVFDRRSSNEGGSAVASASESASASEVLSPSRAKFLPRFRAGLSAEKIARDAEDRRMSQYRDEDDDDNDYDGDDDDKHWAEVSAAAEERQTKVRERRIEDAYDAASARFDAASLRRESKRALLVDDKAEAAVESSDYQFVGVVDTLDGEDDEKKGVTWYARKKPRASKWSARVVHVNRDAALRDMFAGGKVDVFSTYDNDGVPVKPPTTSIDDETTGANGGQQQEEEQNGMKPQIRANYSVQERSWRTLWNFHPRRMFHTSSGAYWRERRLTPGLYTDGASVYEAQYRYRDGKNGFKNVATLEDFLGSPDSHLTDEDKMDLVGRLNDDRPDVVLEK